MGVFIISPNDKGGQLFNPSPLLRQLTAPLTPIQWNARFCLQTPHVHTLSFGLTEAAHFEEMHGIFPAAVPLSPADREILHGLDARLSADPISAYEGYDQWPNEANINVPEILPLSPRNEMLRYGKFRLLSLQHALGQRPLVPRTASLTTKPWQNSMLAPSLTASTSKHYCAKRMKILQTKRKAK